jgi:hypothetical protein
MAAAAARLEVLIERSASSLFSNGPLHGGPLRCTGRECRTPAVTTTGARATSADQQGQCERRNGKRRTRLDCGWSGLQPCIVVLCRSGIAEPSGTSRFRGRGGIHVMPASRSSPARKDVIQACLPYFRRADEVPAVQNSHFRRHSQIGEVVVGDRISVPRHSMAYTGARPEVLNAA